MSSNKSSQTPKAFALDDKTLVNKRNLLGASFVTNIFLYFGIEIEKISVLGIGIKNLDTGVFLASMLSVTAYLLISFLWRIIQENKFLVLYRMNPSHPDFEQYFSYFGFIDQTNMADAIKNRVLESPFSSVSGDNLTNTEDFKAELDTYIYKYTTISKSAHKLSRYRIIIIEVFLPVLSACCAIVWGGISLYS